MECGPRAEEEGGGHHPEPAAAAGERRVVRWERFLPRRSLRVLLVESDDSTRHIVAALLRKCSYHVAAVADGMKAWEVLKERRYSVDLVLTEVDIPSLSGIGLLSKIMGAEECNNIPVIMMSSHDSIGVVLKCMLKGAVDFLVKPVRKNELRNLWQHVWRKHCASSYMDASDNNAASNHISANADDRSKAGDNSDGESDAQSSGSKPDMEIESVRKHMQTQPAGGTSFSRDVEENVEQPNSNIVMLASGSKLDEGRESKDKPVKMGFRKTLSPQEGSITERSQEQNHHYDVSPYGRTNLDFVRSTESYRVDPNLYSQNNAPNESVQDIINFMELKNNIQYSSLASEKDVHKENAQVQTISNSGMSPLWELSLRRPQLDGFLLQDSKGRNILKHSNSSAFSRYGDRRIHPSCQNSNISASCTRTREHAEKCQLHIRSHGTENANMTEVPSEERLSSPQGDVDEANIYIQVPSGSSKEDASLLSPGVPRENAYVGYSSNGENTVLKHPQYGFISLPIPFGATSYQTFCGGYGAILQPVFYLESSLSPHNLAAAEKATVKISSDQPGQDDNHIINHPQSIESHGHAENQDQWRHPINMEHHNENYLTCNAMEETYQSGSCGQDFLKGSGSNGNGETTDVATNTRNALESGNESGVQNCSRKGLDSDHSCREAALIKFRLKRKDRCFEKKVRYHSRKKLAEQRPRVKGQFVRQKILESVVATETDDNC